MRGRTLSLVVLAAIVAAVAFSLRREERFSVEGLRLADENGALRVAGTLFNDGAAVPRVLVDVSVVGPGGGPTDKETLELRDVGAGARVPFAGRPHRGEIRTYSVQVSEGPNPYGN